jgi:hypothetical protein
MGALSSNPVEGKCSGSLFCNFIVGKCDRSPLLQSKRREVWLELFRAVLCIEEKCGGRPPLQSEELIVVGILSCCPIEGKCDGAPSCSPVDRKFGGSLT